MTDCASATRRLCAVALVLTCAAALPASGADPLAGRILHVDCDTRLDPALFRETVRTGERREPKQVVVFDKSFLPSNYKTCHVEKTCHDRLKILRPYDSASFPRNVAPPKFRWEDPVNNLWELSLTAPGWNQPLRVITSRRSWRPDAATWDAIKSAAAGRSVILDVRGCRLVDGKPVHSQDQPGVDGDKVTFRVSEYATDPLIVFRLVTPLFHGLKTPDILYRDVATFERKAFLPGKKRYCTNCHSFPVSPDVAPEDIDLAIAVRQQVIPGKQRRILGLYNFSSRRGRTLNINSFFMSWDPFGTKVAVTSGHFVQVRPLVTLETQEFYVLVADIKIVDSDTLEPLSLPGASEAGYMESFPTWSPDGKTIAFARAREISIKRFEERRYDLYTVPYNDGRGGKPTPVTGASDNSKSNYAPRYSPDGKWIVFNQADWSSLVAPTADLWIVATQKGARPRKLECNVPEAMDSHHSWSSNGRWLLFASKRDDGIFARIYLTEIDENGRASPPVEFPTIDDPMMCYNVPEFLKTRLPIDADDILKKTSSVEGSPDS